MDPKGHRQFPAWQNQYSLVLRETDRERLFTRIEIAEAALRMRLEAITTSSDHHAEREAIADALTKLSLLKKRRLGFYGTGDRAVAVT